MRKGLISFLSLIFAPFAAFSANEGVPSYYQTARATNANQAGYNQYAAQGYTKYVGSSGNKQTIGSRTYSYQVPRAPTYVPQMPGVMTPNGIAMPMDAEPATSIYAGYARRFADFEFETGVNSILEWDDMIWNEIRVGARHNFSLRDFDLSLYGEYAYGDMSHGGLSMDYDLKPYDTAYPDYGIFTISVLIIGLYTILTNYKKISLKEIYLEKPAKTVLLNAGMILFVLFHILLILKSRKRKNR